MSRNQRAANLHASGMVLPVPARSVERVIDGHAMSIAHLATVARESASKHDVAGLLYAVRQIQQRTDSFEVGVVTAARAGGMTWAEVGAHLGMSKQSAMSRFAGLVAPTFDERDGWDGRELAKWTGRELYTTDALHEPESEEQHAAL